MPKRRAVGATPAVRARPQSWAFGRECHRHGARRSPLAREAFKIPAGEAQMGALLRPFAAYPSRVTSRSWCVSVKAHGAGSTDRSAKCGWCSPARQSWSAASRDRGSHRRAHIGTGLELVPNSRLRQQAANLGAGRARGLLRPLARAAGGRSAPLAAIWLPFWRLAQCHRRGFDSARGSTWLLRRARWRYSATHTFVVGA